MATWWQITSKPKDLKGESGDEPVKKTPPGTQNKGSWVALTWAISTRPSSRVGTNWLLESDRYSGHQGIIAKFIGRIDMNEEASYYSSLGKEEWKVKLQGIFDLIFMCGINKQHAADQYNRKIISYEKARDEEKKQYSMKEFCEKGAISLIEELVKEAANERTGIQEVQG